MDNPMLNSDIFLSYYGDDFTGSTDVMETLALNGIPTALFLDVPDRKEVDDFRLKIGIGSQDGSNKIWAFGVAGISRSLGPQGMEDELPAIFEKISKIPSDFFQYKICSTFDSSVAVGNIGHAVEIALKYFPSHYIPLMVGAPFLNRFVVFGNLFARVDQQTFRLDRHPTMKKHPVTPMNESDLRVHLAKQTKRAVKLMDIFGLEGVYGDPAKYFSNLIEQSGNYLLFDTLSVDHLQTVGELLINGLSNTTQLLVGASGINYALAFHLQQLGKIKKSNQLQKPGISKKMVIMAGSCAPATAGQLKYMESIGHQGIRIDTLKLVNPIEQGAEVESVINQSLKALENGQVPILYTALGPEDLVISMTQQWLDENRRENKNTGQIIAEVQGVILRDLIKRTGKLRVAVAGGDTSGYVSRALAIYALETLCPISPGAPLCIAHSRDRQFDGLEISLKGGQNGNEKYFESIMKGELLN